MFPSTSGPKTTPCSLVRAPHRQRCLRTSAKRPRAARAARVPRNARIYAEKPKSNQTPNDAEGNVPAARSPLDYVKRLVVDYGTEEGRVARAMRQLGLQRKEKIGHGVVGQVYRSSMGEGSDAIDVAVKCLSPEAAKKRHQRERFAMEMDIWAPLDHPNVVRVFHAVRSPGMLLATELCTGGRLLKYLQAGRTWIQEQCEVGQGVGNATCQVELDIRSTMLDVARGLDHLHSLGILHGDLKSANVLLSIGEDGDMVAKLCDFGSAERVGLDGRGISRKVRTAVTAPWSAPEVLDPTLLPRPLVLPNDVYSFGMVMYELLIQGLPWTYECGDDGGDRGDECTVLSHAEMQQLVVVERRRPVIPPWVAAQLGDLLQACWAHVPSDRPTMPQVIAALEAIDDADWKHMQLCAYRPITESADSS